MSENDWRPIGTAPADGTNVLVGKWVICEGEPLFYQGVSWYSETWKWGGNEPPNPTHWQPLPAPPPMSAHQ
jgi:hypothetical protein